jgi:Ca-activated chloride channel family protein
MKNIMREEDLTRYVLGEVSAEEKIEIERQINANAQLQAEVKSLRQFTASFSTELKKEVSPGLGDKEHEKIEKIVGKTKVRRTFMIWAAPLSMAFGVMALIYFTSPILVPKFQNVEVTEIPKVAEKNKAPEEQTVLQNSPLDEVLSGKSAMTGVADGEAYSYAQRKKGDSGAAAAAPGVAMKEGLGAVGYTYGGQSADLIARPTKSFMPIEQDKGRNTENYAHITENGFKKVGDEPYSTFSIDVDTAGYSVMRRFINQGSLPDAASVRIEELLNYFPYEYASPQGAAPFATNIEMTTAPWNAEHKLLRVGLKAKAIDWKNRPSSNLVFLLDVSGSMDEPNKLPLVKTALKMLVENLGEKDKVAIVVYAGASGLALPATHANDRAKILSALDNLQAGGSTNGGDGIRLAYKIAQENFIPGGINRVMLATDGDFNVGTTSESELVSLIEEKAKSKVFLTVMGFGMGNYKDTNLEKLANKGNGSYGYIDNANEARKMLVEQVGGTMMTVAKDVKIQIEFNPNKVSGYRLIGYENRLLNKEDFNDDTKDAGEVGSGHTITALYEIIPAGKNVPGASVDPLRYQNAPKVAVDPKSKELLNFKLRFKKPEGDTSDLITIPVEDSNRNFAEGSGDFKFQAAVAEFGMILRDSKFKGSSSFDGVIEKVQGNLNHVGAADPYRTEFLELVKKAKTLKK